jgi:hypothetical protein
VDVLLLISPFAAHHLGEPANQLYGASIVLCFGREESQQHLWEDWLMAEPTPAS